MDKKEYKIGDMIWLNSAEWVKANCRYEKKEEVYYYNEIDYISELVLEHCGAWHEITGTKYLYGRKGYALYGLDGKEYIDSHGTKLITYDEGFFNDENEIKKNKLKTAKEGATSFDRYKKGKGL